MKCLEREGQLNYMLDYVFGHIDTNQKYKNMQK